MFQSVKLMNVEKIRVSKKYEESVTKQNKTKQEFNDFLQGQGWEEGMKGEGMGGRGREGRRVKDC